MEVLAFNVNYKGDAYKFNSNLFEYIKLWEQHKLKII
jgi:hypothetical protein